MSGSLGPRSAGRYRLPRVLALVAMVWTLAVSVYWALAPTVTLTSVSAAPVPAPVAGGTGEGWSSTRHVTLVEDSGASILLVLAVPVVVAALGAAPWSERRSRAARLSSGAVLAAAALVAVVSLGLPYLPAAVLLLVAAFKTPRVRDVEHNPSPALGR